MGNVHHRENVPPPLPQVSHNKKTDISLSRLVTSSCGFMFFTVGMLSLLAGIFNISIWLMVLGGLTTITGVFVLVFPYVSTALSPDKQPLFSRIFQFSLGFGAIFILLLSVSFSSMVIASRAKQAEEKRRLELAKIENEKAKIEFEKKLAVEKAAAATRTPSNSPPSVGKTTSGSGFFHAGDQVTLTGNGLSLSPTSADWDEAAKRAARKDQLGFAQLIASGRLIVPGDGTAAQVLSVGFEAIEVRIVEGKYLGQSGWVAKQFVVHSK